MRLMHNVDTMTVGRYGTLDETNNISLLKTNINPFPVRWFNPVRVLNDISGIFHNDNRELIVQKGRVILYNKILILEACLSGIQNIVINKSANEALALTARIKTDSKDNYNYFCAIVKAECDIDVKKLSDIIKLKDHINQLTDKYKERYKDKPKNEGTPFIKYAMSVFLILDMPYISDVTLREFKRLTEIAADRVRELDKIKHKHGRNY